MKQHNICGQKNSYLLRDGGDPAEIYDRAGILAEFGKIICISVGIVTNKENAHAVRTKSFYGDSEKELLNGFAQLLTAHYSSFECLLCAHNGKEFDFPYICRRMC